MEWELFLYRLPAGPSSRARVAVWRELRRLGALPLGQAAVAAPAEERFTASLDRVERRVEEEGGSSYRFRPLTLDDAMRARLRDEWNALRTHEYAEIVEECRTKFLKEIEFELFRGNLTASEAEEIEADLDKIRAWVARVGERDVFGAPGREEVDAAVVTCELALDDFLERVYRAESAAGPGLDAPLDLPWGEIPEGVRPADVIDLPPAPRPTPERAPRKKKGGRA